MKRTKTIPTSEIQEQNQETISLVLNTVRGKNFVMVYQPFVKTFGVLTGYYLSLLLDQYAFHEKKNQLKENMFYFTHESASKMMNEKEYSIKQAKKKLKDLNFIYLIKKGIPSKEYIGINFNKIKDLIENKIDFDDLGQDPKFSGGQGVKFSGGHNIKQNLIKTKPNKDISIQEKKDLDSSDKNPKIIPSKKINKYLPIAKKLSKIISTHKKINCNQNINAWTKPIELLFTKDLKINGYSSSQIKKRVLVALNFYKNHIGEEYIPVIQSGNSFREKFIKLEDAMQRENNTYPTYSKKSKKPKKNGAMMDEATLKRIKEKTIILN